MLDFFKLNFLWYNNEVVVYALRCANLADWNVSAAVGCRGILSSRYRTNGGGGAKRHELPTLDHF